jgi:hypothetical protein
MNILNRPEQAYAPVDQPTHFPRFFLIPETTSIPSQRPASNDPGYNQSPSTNINLPQENKLRNFLRPEKEIIQETCTDSWTEIKQTVTAAVHSLIRWVVLPLSIACALYIPSIHPMELFPL